MSIKVLKPADVVAVTVEVLCPNCTAPLPNKDGFLHWTSDQFPSAAQTVRCVECGERMRLRLLSRVRF